jgi:hypothetical protein
MEERGRTMSVYDSDALDDACQKILGHDNWGYIDKSDLKKEFEHYDKVKDNIAYIVVLWKKSVEDELDE